MSDRISAPLPLRSVRVSDPFWSREMNLIRTAVIPYQWDALNDRIPGAAPSWWAHNMRAAARAIAAKQAGGGYTPVQQNCGFVVSPEEGKPPMENGFYGFVFQDSDGYKWLEAVAYQLTVKPDAALQKQAQEAVDLIRAAQEEDGYLNTYYSLTGRENAFTNLKDHHELYCFGHLTEAAVAWKQATGKDDLLDVARRFGRCIARRFGPDGERGCPGHEIAEMALYRLYEETGEAEWKELAQRFLDVRGTDPSTFALEENRRLKKEGKKELPVTAERYRYYQAHKPVREMDEAVGHAVRQMYLASGMADEARLTGDEAMLAACERLWRSTVNEKMYVTGGVGGTHVGEAFSRPYDLPSDTAYSETCAAIGLAFFARRMLQLRPMAEYADVMERALYNTVLSGMALDGKSFFYVNPLEVNPAACETDERLSHVKPVRQKWFGCACCPPNIARIVSSLGQYIATQSEDTLYIHLYIGSEITAQLNGQEITLKLDADLRKGTARLTVLSGEGAGTLAFRAPAWADHTRVAASGAQHTDQADGYLLVSGHWQAGDSVEMAFDISVQAVAASPLVRETMHQVCYSWGPWVYCAEEADNGKKLHLLRACPEKTAEAQFTEKQIDGLTVPALIVPGKRVTVPENAPLYAPWEKPKTTETKITLVPYFAWNNRGKGEMRVWLETE
ncbi:MAG: glycoside hydrolase family 127 protein [Clostridia bacterium]|nr:glycoside hydrolase family 127 protein [Clostridia bacterium]